MAHDWNPGDRCKVRPVYTLPASTRSHYKIRSPYYCMATVKFLQHSIGHTTVFVELDRHEQLPLAGCDRLQAASLFELHGAACQCRRCRKTPSNWRAEPWPTRAKRVARALLRWTGRALAWCWRALWEPCPPAKATGK